MNTHTMNIKKPIFLFIYLVISIMGCSKKLIPYSISDKEYIVEQEPDYSDQKFWAAHPEKWDPSDSVPEPLRSNQLKLDADVFFVHPTTYTGQLSQGLNNALINDAMINKKTDYSSILYQASAFNEARVFAPRYRQAHIQMYYNSDSTIVRESFNLAYGDVKSAFEYYLKYWNNGRPIIIASHSQGTTHAKKLLKELVENSAIRNKLVAAYLIGIPVEKELYLKIQPCKDTTDNGCFVSWRTYREGYKGSFTSSEDSSIIVTNPVTWKIDGISANREMHKGAVLYKFNKVYPRTHETRVSGNMLFISRPKFPGSILYKEKNYHAGDINLFYIDIREDLRRRIASYYRNL